MMMNRFLYRFVVLSRYPGESAEPPAEGEPVAVANDDDDALLCVISQDLIGEGDFVRKLRCPHSLKMMNAWKDGSV